MIQDIKIWLDLSTQRTSAKLISLRFTPLLFLLQLNSISNCVSGKYNINIVVTDL